MNRFVFNIFKTIMFAMIFVFVWDIGFYLYRVTNLNQRMNSLMTSMQKVVMENNYLPESAYNTYEALFTQIADSYNNNGDTARGVFINGFRINYKHESERNITLNATRNGVSSNIVRKQMDEAHKGSYGDVMIVDVEVSVNAPVWDFTTSNNLGQTTVDGGERGAAAWQNDGSSAELEPYEVTLNYTYYVPCMKYQTLTD